MKLYIFQWLGLNLSSLHKRRRLWRLKWLLDTFGQSFRLVILFLDCAHCYALICRDWALMHLLRELVRWRLNCRWRREFCWLAIDWLTGMGICCLTKRNSYFLLGFWWRVILINGVIWSIFNRNYWLLKLWGRSLNFWNWCNFYRLRIFCYFLLYSSFFYYSSVCYYLLFDWLNWLSRFIVENTLVTRL